MSGDNLHGKQPIKFYSEKIVYLPNSYQPNEEDKDVKEWNQALIPKAILLFHPIVFALTFLKINTDKSIIDLLGFIAIGVLLVFGGIFLNYLLSKGK